MNSKQITYIQGIKTVGLQANPSRRKKDW